MWWPIPCTDISSNFIIESHLSLNWRMGWGNTLTFRPHDHTHKSLRRLLASALNPVQVRTYLPQQSESVAALIRQIHFNPSQFIKSINGATSSFVIRTAYGYVPEESAPFMDVNREAMRYLAIGTMSHFWVNWFPICESFLSGMLRTTLK